MPILQAPEVKKSSTTTTKLAPVKLPTTAPTTTVQKTGSTVQSKTTVPKPTTSAATPTEQKAGGATTITPYTSTLTTAQQAEANRLTALANYYKANEENVRGLVASDAARLEAQAGKQSGGSNLFGFAQESVARRFGSTEHNLTAGQYADAARLTAQAARDAPLAALQASTTGRLLVPKNGVFDRQTAAERLGQGGVATGSEARARGLNELAPSSRAVTTGKSQWIDEAGNLTIQGLNYAANYTGKAVIEAMRTNNPDLLPNIMSPQMAAAIGLTTDEYLLWYTPDGKRRDLVNLPTYADGLGSGDKSGGGKASSGTGSKQSPYGWRYGVIQWRI